MRNLNIKESSTIIVDIITNLQTTRITPMSNIKLPNIDRGHHGRDRMALGFTTTYGICAYHH